ncbi:hypothetical protein HYPSUDRAFT_151755 [Hypholoma sublateritium FD-334 SS-4]|uniref:Uncharacterized protein n=1 Tax=Hypholoma sublateritium (strain FD-334 SS-4) TaxID=945553 RepID=A0A0D2NXT2_HYPSF|nr:hypothetical protein HYPSUDRAFT_151755 [Hypholoma sublateritium FD-334 SS-4]
MHLGTNVIDAMLSLWRGLFTCESTDSKRNWDWALQLMDNNVWQAHGKLVASATKYFPSFFHCPPRNPAEKLSSGYKATELYLYVFGLGPGFFRQVLAKKYWKNFCKLVRGFRVIMQRSISGQQAQDAHFYLIQFVEEYENIYYQRRADQIHFNRPCFHTLLHAPQEVFCVGNAIHTDQFTMERAIGELGQNIRQPSNPYGALTQLALRKAKINALKSICPELDNDLTPHTPWHAHDMGNGHVLLRPREETAHEFSDKEHDAIRAVCNVDKCQKWGRLQLPNGQVARSLYSENRRLSENKRNTRNVKNAYVVLSKYSSPDQDLLEESFHTLHACSYLSQESLVCVPLNSIVTVVSMQPLPLVAGDPENLWFVVEKCGLDDTQLFGNEAPAN